MPASTGGYAARCCAQAIVIMCADGAGWCELDGVRHEIGPGAGAAHPAAGAPQLLRGRHAALVHLVAARRRNAICPRLLTGHRADRRRADGGARSIRPGSRARRDPSATISRTRTRPRSAAAAAGGAWNLLARLGASAAQPVTPGTSPSLRVQAYLRENLSARSACRSWPRMARLSPSHFSARFRAASRVLSHRVRQAAADGRARSC